MARQRRPHGAGTSLHFSVLSGSQHTISLNWTLILTIILIKLVVQKISSLTEYTLTDHTLTDDSTFLSTLICITFLDRRFPVYQIYFNRRYFTGCFHFLSTLHIHSLQLYFLCHLFPYLYTLVTLLYLYCYYIRFLLYRFPAVAA